MIREILQVVGMAIAVYGLRTWRLQIVRKRRFEIAEETVLAAYRVRNDLKYIRTDASFWGEAKDRPTDEDEPPEQRRLLDRYYIPLKRIQETNDNFSELSKYK